jgi:hypothetical protein
VLLFVRNAPPTGKKLLVATIAVTVALFFIPVSRTFPNWLQMNLVEENVRDIFTKPSPYAEEHGVGEEVRSRFFGRDLLGQPIVQYPYSEPNVLVVIVEGISYEYSKTELMPNFKKVAEDSISYGNFVSLQRQTNRGLYSIVCGDYPNYLGKEAKSDIVGVFGTRRPCLPAILRQSGYRTVFMQSAPLGYMRKDLFAEEAGYGEIIGSWDFKEYNVRGFWGVDDATLYHHAVQKIRQLISEGKPWFLTLLTVGTHHPYTVPGIANPSDEQAVQYADHHFGEFVKALKQERLIDNALVIITSDEASLSNKPEGLGKELSTTHAPLIIISPQVEIPMVHEGLFTQADLQLSVIDYLGLAPYESIGRSIFRKYSKDRDILTGSVYSSKIYGISSDNKLYVCDRDVECSAYGFRESGPFESDLSETEVDAEYVAAMRQALSYNELSSDKLRTDVVFQETNRKYFGRKLLIGDHKVSAKTGDTIIWKVSIDAENDMKVLISIKRYPNPEPLVYEVKQITPENPLDFRYKFDARENISDIWTAVIVTDSPDTEYLVKELTIERHRAEE